MEEYISMWKNAAYFGGRASQRDFWMAVLFHFLAIALLFGSALVLRRLTGLELIFRIFSPIITAYYLISIIPLISLTVCRLRDSGHGWYCLFLVCIPFGAFVLFVFLIQSTKPELGSPLLRGRNTTQTSISIE